MQVREANSRAVGDVIPEGVLRVDVAGSEADVGWSRDLSLAWVASVLPGGAPKVQAEIAVRKYAFEIGLDAGISTTDLIWWVNERSICIYRGQLGIGATWRDPQGSAWTVTDDSASDKDLSQLPQVRLTREASKDNLVIPIWEMKSRWTPISSED